MTWFANAISACVHWPVLSGTSLDATLAWGRLREDMAVLALAFDQRSRSLAALCNPDGLRLADLGPGRRSARRKVRGAELPYETHGSWSPRRPTLADAQL